MKKHSKSVDIARATTASETNWRDSANAWVGPTKLRIVCEDRGNPYSPISVKPMVYNLYDYFRA